MSFTNHHTLRSAAYSDEEKLNVRIQTHRLYTRPDVDFQRWVLDRIAWRGDEVVVDVGCGSGAYAVPVGERAARYIAGDLSYGMLAGVDTPARVNLLVETLPFRDASVDVVLANHMLYHVEDRDTAIAQLARVLRPGGALIAATNDSDTPSAAQQIFDLAFVELGHPRMELEASSSFSLANGAAQLERHFADVAVARSESALVFESAEPVVAYAQSSRELCEDWMPRGVSWDEMIDALARAVRGSIEADGVCRVPKVTGAFVCRTTEVS